MARMSFLSSCHKCRTLSSFWSIKTFNQAFRFESSYSKVKFEKQEPKRIPGPKGLPVIGNANHARNGGLPVNVWSLRKQYGDMFKLNFGKLSMIVVMGHKSINEILVNHGDQFSHRPNWLYIPDKIFNKKGIIWTGGEDWDKLQRLILKAVHDKQIQSRIHKEILGEFDVVSKIFEKSNGRPVYPEDQFWKAALNVVSSFIFGKRFHHDDPEFQKFQDTMQFVAVNSKTQNLPHLFPWSAVFLKSKINKLKQQNEEISKLLRVQLELHEQQRGDSGQQHDFIDAFLSLSQEERQHSAYLEDSIFKTIVDMYHGSMESMSGLLLWTVVYMCRFPDIQEKCQTELDKILGDKDDFVIDRLNEIPYTEATAKEIRRICGVVPFSALHTNTSDVTISEMTIPRHSILLFHLQSACMDKDFWENPEEFQPIRFLKEPQSPSAFKPFGYGPRCCKGTDIAIATHVTFLANMLRRFQIVPAEKTSLLLLKEPTLVLRTDQRNFKSASSLDAILDFKSDPDFTVLGICPYDKISKWS